jgi:hypothetical protein
MEFTSPGFRKLILHYSYNKCPLPLNKTEEKPAQTNGSKHNSAVGSRKQHHNLFRPDNGKIVLF